MIKKLQLNKGDIRIKRALISVFDKTGLVEFAKTLETFDIEILSTGGTAKTLKDSNVDVTDNTDYTKIPEIMNGREKTINP